MSWSYFDLFKNKQLKIISIEFLIHCQEIQRRCVCVGGHQGKDYRIIYFFCYAFSS